MHRWSVAFVLASLATMACDEHKRLPAELPVEPAPAVLDGDGKRVSPGPLRVPQRESAIFTYAALVSQPAEPPPRYSAPFPAELETAQGDWADHAPPELVAARICRGDDETRSDLVAALDRLAASGATRPQLVRAYGQLMHCGAPAYCAWARDESEAERSPAVREFFWYALQGCSDDATREHFAKRGAPHGALFLWTIGTEPRDLDARFVARLRTLVRETTDESNPDVEDGLLVLALAEDDASVRSATKLYTETKHPRLRAILIRTLARNPSPVAQAFFAKHCDELDPPDCDVDLDWREPIAAPFDDLATTVRTHEDVVGLWRGHPDERGAIETALRQCVTGPDDVVVAEACLIELARIDRPSAVDLATALLRDPEYADATSFASVLQQFPARGALEDHLDALGLGARPGSTPDPDAIGLVDVLVARGRATAFAADDGVIPHEHHVLLDELASLMSPDLDGVVFEQRVPRVVDGYRVDPDEGYTLIAYMDGRRHEVAAQDFGDWIDLQAVFGLLNALARERGASSRIVSAPTTDELARAIAGPHSALDALAKANLIRLESELDD